MTIAVSVRSLEVTLGGTKVLRGVDLVASKGEWVNIIGPNGAGKTTLLRALLGLVSFDGEIDIDGLSDQRRRSARARMLAYVPQTPVIPPGMLVADYVLLGRTPHRGVFAAETATDRRVAAQVLDRLDLGGFGDRSVQSLSGGERQRAVMARALAQQADVLLLDEPTTALDLGHQQDVLDLVDALRRERGLTVIATLHDLTLAARYGDRIAILAPRAGRRDRAARRGAHRAEHRRPLRSDRADRRRPRGPRDRAHGPGEPFAATGRPRRPEWRPTMTTTDSPPTEDPRPGGMRTARSLVVVNTGDGKGKSSAAFGTAMRARARGWPVAVVQFLKSDDWVTGEQLMAEPLGIDFWSLGEGFTWDSDDLTRDEAEAREAWRHGKALVEAGEHRLVVFDEITYPLNWGWIDAAEVEATFRNRPENVSLVLTGRDAPAWMIELADTATEMVKTKHAYDSGIMAKKGIDY